jgi:hypothetical protein
VYEASVREARVAYNGVCSSGIESRREHANNSPSIIFDDERQILEALAVVSEKPTLVEKGPVPRLGR